MNGYLVGGSDGDATDPFEGRSVSTVRVGRFLTRAEAEVARGMLETSGVPAVVIGDDGGGVQPDISYGYGGVALGVHPDDVDEATALLADVAPPLPIGDLRTPGWRSTLVLVTAAVLVALIALQLAQNFEIITLR